MELLSKWFRFPPFLPTFLSLLPFLSPAIVDEVRQDGELVESMGRELHLGMRHRLEADPDYSPASFPSADKFYRPNPK